MRNCAAKWLACGLGPQDEEGTPIKQDVKKGKPRFYHQPIPWNYGMLPQATHWPAHGNALRLVLLASANLTVALSPVGMRLLC